MAPVVTMEFACSHVVCDWRPEAAGVSLIKQQSDNTVAGKQQQQQGPVPPPLPPRRLGKPRPTSLPPVAPRSLPPPVAPRSPPPRSLPPPVAPRSLPPPVAPRSPPPQGRKPRSSAAFHQSWRGEEAG
ncbi:lysine-rich arabinogalactan protein 19-like [Cyclopterus lumpus]|uniref:lysine-rich arabinogalactan protein 19-like n=1 Tax=Cyclopterus lumpus TaxID=8103 RepID=UPI0014874790|nr:lysine-rich arabinogalactan protein 19-like [Cyclopterus lumpus]